jgi:hypothetical protein
MVTLEPRRGLLQVREAWQEHIARKPSSCTPFPEDNRAEDNSEKSICRCHWPNSFVILNDSEELYPSLSRLGRTSLPTMRAEAEAHEEAKPTWDPCSSRGHALRQEGSRSSSPCPYPAGGITDTSSVGSRRLPFGRPRCLGKPCYLPEEHGALPAHPLRPITRAECLEDQACKKPGWMASPACYPFLLASILLAPDAEGTTDSIRRMHTG